jgi:hypothetical protein
LPIEPLLEGSPGDPPPPPRSVTATKTMVTPTVVARATPIMNAAEFHTGFALVTKIMAKMICGPANMVRARGKIARFMISFQYIAVRFHWL